MTTRRPSVAVRCSAPCLAKDRTIVLANDRKKSIFFFFFVHRERPGLRRLAPIVTSGANNVLLCEEGEVVNRLDRRSLWQKDNDQLGQVFVFDSIGSYAFASHATDLQKAYGA